MSIKVSYNPLRRKESRQLVDGFCSSYPKICESLGISPSSAVYEAVFKDKVVYVVDGVPVAFKSEGSLFPTLVSAKMAGMGGLHYAVVDEGAVRPILNGADVMAPGIKKASGFGVGDVVVVWSIDEKTPLAVTKALMSSGDVASIRRGKALRSLHYAGDGLWSVSLDVLKKFGRL